MMFSPNEVFAQRCISMKHPTTKHSKTPSSKKQKVSPKPGNTSSSTEVRVIDPKTGGEKGSKPERYDLIPSSALDEVARVYGFGSRKYAVNNWVKGYDWGLSIAALERHISAFKQGEDLDPESGLHHLAHAVFHCLALVTFGQKNLGTDTRLVFP